MRKVAGVCMWVALACVVLAVAAVPAAAREAPSARVGAYYFDGWSGPLTAPHFQGMVGGPFSDRRPLYGWRDAKPPTMARQLGWARGAGIGFFLFQWFHNPRATIYPYLGTGLANYRRLRDRRGVGFAIDYVNGAGPDANFIVPRQSWRAVARRWARDFADPGYVRVRGKPLFVIHDTASFTAQWGGTAGVNRALATLRQVARRRGLPGVFVVGGVHVDHQYDWAAFPAPIAGQRYDAITQFAYPEVVEPRIGAARPFRDLFLAERANWNRYAAETPVPYIPDVMAGWDSRPWAGRTDGRDLFWFERSPADVGRFLRAAVRWVRGHPAMRVGRRPLVLLASWNELGEGHFVVPTVGSRFSYLKAVAAALGVSR